MKIKPYFVDKLNHGFIPSWMGIGKHIRAARDAAKLTQGQPFATLEISAAASAFNASVLIVLSEPRYSSHDMPAAIP